MSEPTPARERWYHSVWFVLLMLFVVLGPFGLPLLWKSPKFAPWAKWALTVLSIAFVIWLTVQALAILRASLASYQSF